MRPIDSTSRKPNCLVSSLKALSFSSWSFASMMILISSRIVFSLSDVSESGKEAVAAVLITFLVLILLRTLFLKYYRRINRSQPLFITPGLVRSLDAQTRTSLGEMMLDYTVLHRMRAVEVDLAYVIKNKATRLFQTTPDLNELQTENAILQATKVEAVAVVSLNQMEPEKVSQHAPAI
jgi:hypothetical protein